MKRILSIIILLVGIAVPNAFCQDNPTKRVSFLQTAPCKFIYDTSETNYCGLDSATFIRYYAAKSKIDEDIFNEYVRGIGYNIKQKLERKGKFNFSPDSICVNYVLFHLDEIGPQAGLKATATLYDDISGESFKYHFNIPDGRLNSFDVLLQENLDLLISSLFTKIKNTHVLRQSDESDAWKVLVKPEETNPYEDPIYR